MFPSWPVSSPEPHASRPSAHSFSAPAGQNLPFTFSSRSCQSVNRQMLFLQLRFPRRENTRCIFFQHPKPSFPAWPANTSRHHSFHTGPHNPKSANSLPPGLAGRRLTSLPTTFLISTKHHLPTQYRFPPFFQNPPITIFPNILPTHLRHLYIAIPSFHTSSFFYFLYRRHPPGLRLSVPTSHHFPNALHFFRPAAASPTRRPNAKRSFARGCSLQGCRWCGRGARVSFFFFLFFSSFPSSFPSPWRRGFAATPSFFFLLLFFFLFFLFVFLSFYFCSYLCFFLFIFSLYFSSCFFLFVFSFFYFYFSFYFLFLFYFYFLFLLSFCFYFYLCLLYFFSLFFFLVFIFASPFLFFVFLFVLLFYPPYSNLFPHYPTARQPFIFFSSAANLSHSLQPLLGSSKKKKISAKESTGVEWPPGSERAAE